MATDLAAIYSSARERLTAYATTLDDDALATPVPACPGWDVKDVLAHLAGLTADVTAGRLDCIATPPWTEAQVLPRRQTPVTDILAEWSEHAPTLETFLASPQASAPAAIDITTHELDIRGALSDTAARDSDSARGCESLLAKGLVHQVEEAGLPSLRVVVDGEPRGLEADEAATTLTIDGFELLRSRMGRRSRKQVRAYAWDGDPEPYLDVYSIFGYRDDALVE